MLRGAEPFTAWHFPKLQFSFVFVRCGLCCCSSLFSALVLWPLWTYFCLVSCDCHIQMGTPSFSPVGEMHSCNTARFLNFQEEWKIEKFRSICCHKRGFVLLLLMWWCYCYFCWSDLRRGALAIPANTFKPCRVQFDVLKHFVSLCRSCRDCSASGVLLTGSKKSLFPLRTFHLSLQVLFWNTLASSILAKFTGVRWNCVWSHWDWHLMHFHTSSTMDPLIAVCSASCHCVTGET